MNIAPKRREQRTLIGQSVQRLDLPAKFSGRSVFLQDLTLPNMLHGRVVRPPDPGAELLEFDDAAAHRLPGVVAVVRDGSFLGVIARREEQAIAAAVAMRQTVKWRNGSGWGFDQTAWREHLEQLPQTTSDLISNIKPVKVTRTLSASYSKPFIAHASIGPSIAIALQESDKLSIWTHSQAVYPLSRALSNVLQYPLKQVHVLHVQGSGCYGHNGADDVALDAALLARASPGRPVRVQWMRDDEFKWEPFGSGISTRVNCGLDVNGNIVDWSYDFWTGTHGERPDRPPGTINLLASWFLAKPTGRPAEGIEGPLPAGGGSRNAIPHYSFASMRVTEHLIKRMPMRTSSLRALGAFANVFAIESMMDEAATLTGVDPLEFRLRHTNDERAKRVMRAVAEHAGWHQKPPDVADRGRGFAFARYKSISSYVALVAEVEVERSSGRIRVHRISAAVDAGEVINPDGLKNQIEGGIIQAASWALKEQVKFDEKQITTRTWSDYPILRFSEIPLVDVQILETPGDPPLGGGEPGVPPVGAVIANAVAAAIGVRLRELPLTPDRVLNALQAVRKD
jgi:CO/xanthine dehydrogenase Mo-binding subunit